MDKWAHKPSFSANMGVQNNPLLSKSNVKEPFQYDLAVAEAVSRFCNGDLKELFSIMADKERLDKLAKSMPRDQFQFFFHHFASLYRKATKEKLLTDELEICPKCHKKGSLDWEKRGHRRYLYFQHYDAVKYATKRKGKKVCRCYIPKKWYAPSPLTYARVLRSIRKVEREYRKAKEHSQTCENCARISNDPKVEEFRAQWWSFTNILKFILRINERIYKQDEYNIIGLVRKLYRLDTVVEYLNKLVEGINSASYESLAILMKRGNFWKVHHIVLLLDELWQGEAKLPLRRLKKLKRYYKDKGVDKSPDELVIEYLFGKMRGRAKFSISYSYAKKLVKKYAHELAEKYGVQPNDRDSLKKLAKRESVKTKRIKQQFDAEKLHVYLYLKADPNIPQEFLKYFDGLEAKLQTPA